MYLGAGLLPYLERTLVIKVSISKSRRPTHIRYGANNTVYDLDHTVYDLADDSSTWILQAL